MEVRGSDASSHRASAHQLGLEPGDPVWSCCPRQGFRKSVIVSVDTGSDSLVIESLDDRAQNRVRRSEVRPFYEVGADRTFDDNTSLPHLDDANILENMRRRYLKDQVYTYTANVLLAVNPYKSMPHLYTTERMAEYSNKGTGPLPPHPYAIADTAYRHLVRERKDQALVISGESGAGKTETAKITMHYLTSVSRTDAAHGVRIQDKIINSNPILESFGNASTVRNMNSSRFGKYNEMWFNRVGSLVGAGIRTFLLESSRVVSQQEGERNYHVFYEMLAGLDQDSLDQLQLDPATRYRLLYQGSAQPCTEDQAELQRRAQRFEELRQALATFADQDLQRDIWDVLAALIHLGEVEFVELEATESSPTEGSQEPLVEVAREGQDAIAQACDLLGLSQCRLEQILKFHERHVNSKGRSRRTSHIQTPRTKAQATQTLQNIIKVLYKRLFEKIVETINVCSAGSAAERPDKSAYGSIGTLDIYGFERLQTNSFEQLCINLANERLQQFFVEEVLEAEQRTYAEEMLHVPRWKLPDSQPVVLSIQGVMAVLDEHSLRSVKNLAGEEKDVRFCEHVHREHVQRGNGTLLAPKLKANRSGMGMALYDGFQVRHYAGEVTYSTRGWIDKNNDALVPEVELLLGDGEKGLVRSMVDNRALEALTGERLQSVSYNYLSNLSQLLATLRNCSVHYIRCFNPNQNRQALTFDTKYVLDQVIQCGTVELVGIMHHGFPNRCFLQDLRQRFTRLLPADFSRYSDRDFVLAIMLAFEIDETQWTLGTKRLFLKAGQLRVLEHLRDLGSTASQDIIRRIRMQFARKKVRAWSRVIHLMRWWPEFMRKQKRAKLVAGLHKAVHIMVRLHRWLRKAREGLYGLPVEVDRPHVEVALRSHGLTFSVPLQSQLPVSVDPGRAELFITLNSYELPHYASYLQNEVDLGNNVDDHVLKVWQKAATESVLFYTGRLLLSAKFSPKGFLRQPGQRLPADMVSGVVPSLDDVRIVDPFETGLAIPVNGGYSRPEGEVTCCCQHPGLTNTFATCNAENTITVWRWLGTESVDVEKVAVKTLGAVLWREQVLAMCFISTVPDRISQKGGLVLAIASSHPGRHWLSIQLVAVYQGAYRIEDIITVGVDAELQPGLREEGFGVSFFCPTHSDRMLMLGGRGLLQFFRVAESPAAGDLTISFVEDVTKIYSYLRDSTMVSCLSLSPAKPQSALEFVAVGDSSGTLYGFLFDVREDHIELNQVSSGKFRQNTHTTGVPIRSLIPTYGTEPFAHHRSIQNKGLPYSLFLNTVQMDERVFHSLAEDGKMLTWKLLQNGWTAYSETCFRSMPCWAEDRNRGRFIASHGSRLVPNVLILADEERELLACFDCTNPDELPVEAMCSLA